ncbi:PDZ domain-containing protein [Elusimicrobiota bacterium]
MKSFSCILLSGFCVFVLLNSPKAFASEKDVKNSVVQFFTVSKKPSYYQPWDTGYQQNFGGSGCIIKGNRVITNAHVVSDQVYVQLRKAGETKKYTAQVEHVAHDSEVAILKVADPSFFKGTKPVEFGALPRQRDKVAAYGFPVGGNDLSITEGVVSRIEVQDYTHSRRDLLAIQTDAAINPGNSGGPVFKDGKLIGISFQSYSGSDVENIGYIVPITHITRFLEDIKNGAYDGVPDLGVYWQKLESESLRTFYKLKEGQSGILITRVIYGGSAWNILKEEDVIVSVEDHRVANNGTVSFRKDERLLFSYLVHEKQLGDKVSLKVIRKGAVIELVIPLKKFKLLVTGPHYDKQPTYFIYGGLVFMPLTYNFMKTWEWEDLYPRFKYYLDEKLPSPDQKQIIIISQALAHDINVGYHGIDQVVVEKINGKAITRMQDVIKAFEKPMGSYHVIEIDAHNYSGTRIVLNANKTDEATKQILAQYRIAQDRSNDLK